MTAESPNPSSSPETDTSVPKFKLGILWFRRPYFLDNFFGFILFAVGALLLSKAIYVANQGQIDLSSQSIVSGTERVFIAYHLSFLLLWLIALYFLIKRSKADKKLVSEFESTLAPKEDGKPARWKISRPPYYVRAGRQIFFVAPLIAAVAIIGYSSYVSQKTTKELNATFTTVNGLIVEWNGEVDTISKLVTYLSRTVSPAQYNKDVNDAKVVLAWDTPQIQATEVKLQNQCDHLKRTTTGHNHEAEYRAIVVGSILSTCQSLPIQSRELLTIVQLQISKSSNAEIQKHQDLFSAAYNARAANLKEVLRISGELTHRRKITSTINIFSVLSPI